MAMTLGRPRKTVWDDSVGRYRFKTGGGLVPRAEVEKSLQRGLDLAKRNVARLDRALARKEITSGEWLLGMRDQIRIAHTTSAALGKGGFKQMTPADWGLVGQQTKQQYAALQRYERGIANKLIPVGTPAQQRRSAAYINMAEGSFWTNDMKVAERHGLLARNERGSRDSCTAKNGASGCIEETNKGLVPVYKLTPPKTRVCRFNCNCRIVYARKAKAQ